MGAAARGLSIHESVSLGAGGVAVSAAAGRWRQEERGLHGTLSLTGRLCLSLPRLRGESRAQAWAVFSVAPSAGLGWFIPALLPLGSDSQTRSGQGLN